MTDKTDFFFLLVFKDMYINNTKTDIIILLIANPEMVSTLFHSRFN